MKNRAVVLITDKGFLVPSLVTAGQIKQNLGGRHVDILIYLVSIDESLISCLSIAFEGKGFRFLSINDREFMPKAGTAFREGHVSVTTLARLVLAKYIPEQYEHIIYIDGDTQIVGDITPLLTYDVPEGMVAAIGETCGILDELDPWTKSYLSGIGIERGEDYFNAGVMAFRRSSWAEIGPAALKYYEENAEACFFHDQSALNAVCKGRRVALSPIYNFHTGFAELYVHQRYKPRIVHFTGGGKPWRYPVTPWGSRYAKPYLELVGKQPFLSSYMKMQIAPLPWMVLRTLKRLYDNREVLGLMWRKRVNLLRYMEAGEFPF